MITHPGPSEYPTVSQASHTPLILISFIIFLLMLLLTGCASTAIDEPARSNSSTGDDLVITLSTPDTYTFPSTRAEGDHDGHFLRYTAILFTENSANNSPSISTDATADGKGNRIRRVDKIASAQDGNKIVFSGIPEGYYFIIVFADYITDNNRGEDGLYPDKYYDTKSNANYIFVKDQTDKTAYFNNHNLDFFLDKTPVFKKENGLAVEYTFTLTRCVSRIDVIASGEGSIDALKDLTVKTCKVMDGLNLISGTASSLYAQKNMGGSNVKLDIAEPTSKLLFFYYTFSASSSNMLEATTFTLNPNDGYTFSTADREVPSGKINPQANIIYKVQGDFLSTSQMPSKVAEIKVTTDQNWTTQDHNLPQN